MQYCISIVIIYGTWLHLILIWVVWVVEDEGDGGCESIGNHVMWMFSLHDPNALSSNSCCIILPSCTSIMGFLLSSLCVRFGISCPGSSLE